MFPLPLKQQSTAIAKGNALPATLFQDLPLGVLVMGVEGEIRFVNPAVLDLLGLTESQLYGQTPLAPDWQAIQADGIPFQFKLQSAPARAKQFLLLLLNRPALRDFVLGIYRPKRRDRIWLSVNTEPQFRADGSLEQVICTLSDITNLKLGAALAKIHACSTTLSADPDENINRLTALAGELLGGTWAHYNRLHQGLLWSVGQWQVPPELSRVSEPEDCICSAVIQRSGDRAFVLQELPTTPYARRNPDIEAYQLQTYVGQVVQCQGQSVGALGILYQNPYIPSEADERLLGIIAAAIGSEEGRKQDAIAWAQHEAKWRSLIQTSSNLIAILETNGTICYASPAIQGALGYKPKALIGKGIFAFLHPDDVPQVEESLERLRHDPTTDLVLEFRFRHQDGSWRYIESTYSNLLMSASETRLVANFRDITERKLAETALRQSEAQLREKAAQLECALHKLQDTQAQLIQTEKMSSLGLLIAGIAHEINNPISFIYGNIPHAAQYTQDLLRLIDLYRQHYPQPLPAIEAEIEAMDLEFLSQDLPKVMDSMQLGAERIRQIVQSLRYFSRLDRATREPIDLHQSLDSTLLLLQHRLKGKAGHPPIQVIKTYGEVPRIEAYAGQLNQVFMNILSNAIDALVARFTAEAPAKAENFAIAAPTIEISTAVQNEKTVAIRIADNGGGMPPHVRQQIFDPFFTTKPVGQGTGLGLSISYQIVVEKHGGQLICTSTPGVGTAFTLELPLRQVAPADAKLSLPKT